MSIFISYSTDSKDLVKRIANYLEPLGDVSYWDQNKIPGEKDWDLIFDWIDDSDIVLAVITDKTISRAMAVGQEIGYAQDQGKYIIPLIAYKVEESELGCLKGIIYQRFDKDNPGPALLAIESSIKSWKKKNLIKNIGIFLGIGTFFWLNSRK